jgi:hypothetical protein
MKIVCANIKCNKEFEKEDKEYRRQIKKGRIEFFCTRNCAAIKNNLDNPRSGNIDNLISDNRRDEFTPFKYYINRGKYRSLETKRYDCNITTLYLKNLWEQQEGICPITGWNLILPKDSAYPWNKKLPNNASLDRIDNSKGYIEGNVRFIAFIANMARNEFSDDQVIEFCKATTENNK